VSVLVVKIQWFIQKAFEGKQATGGWGEEALVSGKREMVIKKCGPEGRERKGERGGHWASGPCNIAIARAAFNDAQKKEEWDWEGGREGIPRRSGDVIGTEERRGIQAKGGRTVDWITMIAQADTQANKQRTLWRAREGVPDAERAGSGVAGSVGE